jgi:hypothetical protein
MNFPRVFAVYRPATETFLLLQPELDEKGAITRLKQWAPPNIKDIPAMPEDVRDQFASWLNGNEWYVESFENETEKLKFHDVDIHDQIYKWCHTGYKLVWSNYHVHSRRNSLGSQVWNSSPSVPILDFSSRHIYPRTYSIFYPRWVSVKTSELNETLQRSRDIVHRMEEEIDYKNLRIRTPKPDSEDEYSSDDSSRLRGMSDLEDEIRKSAGNKCLALILVTTLLGSLVGMYGFIGHLIMTSQ